MKLDFCFLGGVLVISLLVASCSGSGLSSQESVFKGRMQTIQQLADKAEAESKNEIEQQKKAFAKEYAELPQKKQRRSAELGKLNTRTRDYIRLIEKKALAETKTRKDKRDPGTIELGTQSKNTKIINPTTTFDKDTSTIFGVYSTKTVPATGSQVTIRWICIDSGGVAPPNTLITETKIKDDNLLNDMLNKVATHYTVDFSVTRPSKGWPLGKYRTEIHINRKLAQKKHFSIE